MTQFGLADRVFFEGFVDPHVFGYAIDLYLDTFPLESGESLNEYITKGGVAISLLPRSTWSMSGALIWLMNIMRFTIVPKRYLSIMTEIFCRYRMLFVEEYISISGELINDNALRGHVSCANKLWLNLTYMNLKEQAKSFCRLVERFAEWKKQI